jgi:hypothetical protein
MNPKELGQVQYQYLDKNGTPLSIRRDYKGEYVEGENEMMPLHNKNLFGSIYIGANNPTYKGADGKDYPDYRREPQEFMDGGALYHDIDYDNAEAAGAGDALFNRKVKWADQKLVDAANTIIEKAKAGENDPVTNKPISESTLSRAKAVKSFFNWIINSPGFKGDAKVPNDKGSDYFRFGE